MAKRISKTFIVFSYILMRMITLSYAQDEEYSLRAIRREYKAQAAKLKTIRKFPSSIQKSPYGAGDYERFIEVGDRLRRYEIHVPPSYTKNKPYPVVLNLHGGGGHAGSARMQSRMDAKADSVGFIVVYPDGTGVLKNRLLAWNAGRCCGYPMQHNVDDVGFTRSLLDDLTKLFRIDPNRVYATGLSNGALMSYRLACELSDRIAAIAPIAGALVFENCRPVHPVSVIHFHGTADESVPYHGGIGKQSVSKTDFPSVKRTIQGWLDRNGISPKPLKTVIKDHATIVTYRGLDGSEVLLVTMEGTGHTWPGGRRMLPKRKTGEISRIISANDMMWDFFQRHPMKSRINE